MRISPISHFCHNFLFSFLKANVGSGGDVTLNWGKTCQALGLMRFCSQLNSSKLTFLPVAKHVAVFAERAAFFDLVEDKMFNKRDLGPKFPSGADGGASSQGWFIGVTTCGMRSGWEKKGMEMWRESL